MTVRLVWRQAALGALIVLGSTVYAAAQHQSADFSISYGLNYDADSRKSPKFFNREAGPGSFQFWLFKRLAFRVSSKPFSSVDATATGRHTGVGDVVFGSAVPVIFEKPKSARPTMVLDYSAKVPTAGKGLGSGELDHQIKASLSKSFNRRIYGQIDSGAYIAGHSNGDHTTNALLALSFKIGLGHPPTNNFEWYLADELDGSTANGSNPGEAYNNISVIHSTIYGLTLTTGAKVGITPYTPKFGLFAGLSFSGNLRLWARKSIMSLGW